VFRRAFDSRRSDGENRASFTVRAVTIHDLFSSVIVMAGTALISTLEKK